MCVFVTKTIVQGQPARNTELVLDIPVDFLDRRVHDWIAEALRETGPTLEPGGVAGQIQSEGIERGKNISSVAVAEDAVIVACVDEVDADFQRVLADGPREVIRDLMPILGRVEARIGIRHAEVCLALHGDLHTAGGRRNQACRDLVIQAILEPAVAQFVHHRGFWNCRPRQACVPRADSGVGVVAHAIAVVEHSLGLDAVWRNPAEVVEAGADGVLFGGAPIDLAEAEFGVSGTRQHLKVPVQEPKRRGALRRGGLNRSVRIGADANKYAVGVEERRTGQRSDQREGASSRLRVEEVEQLVLLDRAADRAAELVPNLRED
jgi:hypothetical protein